MMSLFVLVMNVCDDGDHKFNIISTDYVNVNTTWCRCGTSWTRASFNSPALLIGQLLDLQLPTWKHRHTNVRLWRNPSPPGFGSFSHLPPLVREPPVVSGEECWSTPWSRWTTGTEHTLTVGTGTLNLTPCLKVLFHLVMENLFTESTGATLTCVELLTSPEREQIKTSY